MNRNSGGRSLKTTESSLEIIETVVRNGGATTTVLMEELGLAQSTVHNHVKTLLEYGYLVEEANTYYPGAKFCQIGDYVRQRKPEYVIAGEFIANMSDESELNADFTVEENGHVLSLYNGLPQYEDTHFLNTGQFFNVHNTASGKSVLAEYTNDHVESIIKWRGLPAETENTITSKEELFEELDRVRKQGYATHEEEAIKGMWAIAKVVKNPLGEVIGSFNLSGPIYLHNDEVQESAIELLNESVSAFEERCESKFTDAYGEV